MQSKVKDGALNLFPEQGQEICDFCSSPEVNWDIDCQDIILPSGVASRGGWAACNVCKQLVELGREAAQELLEKRAVDTFMTKYSEERIPRVFAEEFVHALHTEFWRKRGEIHPYYRNAA